MKQLRTVQTSPDRLLTSSMEKKNTKSNESSHTDNSDERNAFQKTSPLRTSPSSNAPSTTSTPPNPAPIVSSASATSSGPTTYQYIAGIVNCPTAPFITATRPCRISLAMSPQNPSTPPATEDPLPPLSLICLLKSSPRRSQAP